MLGLFAKEPRHQRFLDCSILIPHFSTAHVLGFPTISKLEDVLQEVVLRLWHHQPADIKGNVANLERHSRRLQPTHPESVQMGSPDLRTAWGLNPK